MASMYPFFIYLISQAGWSRWKGIEEWPVSPTRLTLTVEHIARVQVVLPLVPRRSVERRRVVYGDRLPGPHVLLRYEQRLVGVADAGCGGIAGVTDEGQGGVDGATDDCGHLAARPLSLARQLEVTHLVIH